MSHSTNNFTPTSRNQQVGYDYGAYAPTSSDWNRRQPQYSRSGSASFPANPDVHRGAPQQSFEDRVLTSPFSLLGFPVHSQSPVQIPILGNLMARDIRPSNRQIIQRSPSGLMNWPDRLPVQVDNSRMNQDEEQEVLNKLKKEIYNPNSSIKKLSRRLSSYYRDETRNAYNEMEKQNENDTMRCAVCLEDFEPKEKVMLTPCNHMFHEDCIVPWVKSNARCPVCRFSLGEKNRESRASDNNFANNIAAANNDELIARELMSVIRAMEESFTWNFAAY